MIPYDREIVNRLTKVLIKVATKEIKAIQKNMIHPRVSSTWDYSHIKYLKALVCYYIRIYRVAASSDWRIMKAKSELFDPYLWMDECPVEYIQKPEFIDIKELMYDKFKKELLKENYNSDLIPYADRFLSGSISLTVYPWDIDGPISPIYIERDADGCVIW